MDLKEEEILGEDIADHWYYQSKAVALSTCLPKPQGSKILDIGAGSGFFSRWLLERGYADKAVCVDTGYSADTIEWSNGKPLQFRSEIETSDADVVLLMDVLEHVDNDAALLADSLAKARRDAQAIITVPAFQFLWSAHDVFLEHYRRYTLKTLGETLEKAGAEPLRMHYFFGSIFPLAAGLRLLRRNSKAETSDLRREPRLVNAMLRGICTLETRAMTLNRLAGLSVFCVCRRK